MAVALGQQKGRSEELWHGVSRSQGGRGSTPGVCPFALARFLWVAKQLGGRARGSEQRNYSSRKNKCRMVVVVENYPGEIIKM